MFVLDCSLCLTQLFKKSLFVSLTVNMFVFDCTLTWLFIKKTLFVSGTVNMFVLDSTLTLLFVKLCFCSCKHVCTWLHSDMTCYKTLFVSGTVTCLFLTALLHDSLSNFVTVNMFILDCTLTWLFIKLCNCKHVCTWLHSDSQKLDGLRVIVKAILYICKVFRYWLNSQGLY